MGVATSRPLVGDADYWSEAPSQPSCVDDAMRLLVVGFCSVVSAQKSHWRLAQSHAQEDAADGLVGRCQVTENKRAGPGGAVLTPSPL